MHSIQTTIKRFLAVSAVAILAAASTQAWAMTDAQFLAANTFLQQANAGDKDAIATAVEKFESLSKAEPTNPVALVHLGAATSMQARTTMLPWKKISFAEDGMGMEDKALALLDASHDTLLVNGVPASLSVRFVTASTFLAVPSMFNRRAQGASLLNDVVRSPLLANASLTFRGAVWMRAAKWAVDDKRVEDAKRFLDMVVKAGAPQADAAKTQLATL